LTEHVLVRRASTPRSRKDHELVCRAAADAAELGTHFRIRHDVFVGEQALFADTDRDEHDDDDGTIHVLGFVDGVAAGAVRLYPLAGDLWKGDRLAVLPEHRRAGIGRPLVKYAVALAGQRGGSRMDAQVQLPNVTFFKVLGWSPVGEPFDAYGVPHQQMTIGLR
jgi:putative N-acetyltransferase (TIGR04045 family)